jgi:acetyl-CoA carboxylase beta subunit
VEQLTYKIKPEFSYVEKFKNEKYDWMQCDICGKRYIFNNGMEKVKIIDKANIEYDMYTKKQVEAIYEIQEFVNININAGYGSVFEDGSKYEVNICQHCFKEKLGQYIRKVGSENE